MIEMNFVRNESGEDCFRASLANLLKLLGDDLRAELVAREFWSHPLLRESCSLFLLPRYVEDVTHGRYVARLYTTLSIERIRRIVANQTPARRRATMEELRCGRVVQVSVLPIRPLSIIIVATKTSHAAVYIGRDMFVDDGELTIHPIDQSRAFAVLTLDAQVGAALIRREDAEVQRGDKPVMLHIR